MLNGIHEVYSLTFFR